MKRVKRWGYLAAVLTVTLGGQSFAADYGEVLVFPSFTGYLRSGAGAPVSYSEFEPSSDFFYAGEWDTWHALAEYLLTDEEHEMERLQLGWRPTAEATVWLGRFHNPLGYWNTEYHHGDFLQTSISRPGIVSFEDNGGPLPLHVSGLLAEGTWPVGSLGAMDFAAAVGYGPDLGSDSLEPLDILKPDEGSHQLTSTLRLAYRPDSLAMNQVGAFVGFSDIPSDDPNLRELEQIQSGFFINWVLNTVRLNGAAFFIHDDVSQLAGRKNYSFTSGYLQAEYRHSEDLTLYSRLEGTADQSNDPYLDRLTEFVRDRMLVGVRFDVARNNAIKLELSYEQRTDQDFAEASAQWALMFR